MEHPLTDARRRRTVRPSRILALTIATVVGGCALVGMSPSAHADGSDNAGFLAHLNALRASHGLPGLVVSSDLASIASAHSQQMMQQQTIFHNPWLTSQVSNWQVLGENVGMGPSVAAIDTAFDNSPEHYANEVNSSYTQVGIGTAWDNRGYLYVTIDFRKPMSAPAPAPRPPAPAPRPPAPQPPAPRPPAPPAAHPAAPRPAAPAVAAPVAAAPAAPVPVASPATSSTSPAAPPPTAPGTTAAAAPSSISPVPVAGDPVARALAFSRLLAGLQ